MSISIFTFSLPLKPCSPCDASAKASTRVVQTPVIVLRKCSVFVSREKKAKMNHSLLIPLQSCVHARPVEHAFLLY